MAVFGNFLKNTVNQTRKYANAFGNVAEQAGHAVHAPELHVSELFGVHHDFANGGGAPPTKKNPLETQSTLNPTGGGRRSASGGAAGAAGPDLSPYRNNVYGDINQINSLYGQLTGQIGQYGAEKRSQLDQNYADQFGANDKNYANAVDTTNGAFTGRGAFDSSFRSNANQQNQDQYNQSNQSLHNAYDENLASLGQTLSGAKAQLGDKPNVDMNQYNDVDSLNSLHQQLGQYINSLKSSQQGLMTNGQLRQQLDGIAPTKSNLSQTLKGTLDKLLAGGGDSAAKQGIANTYISQLPQEEQSYWQNYLQQALNSSNKTPVTA